MESASILIIEDEPHIRRFIRSALEEQGTKVLESATGQRGLIDAATHVPHLIVLDLGLPDISGIDVIKEIRSWSQVPILVLSARSSEEDKIQALDAGADDYLTKPFSIGELLARLRAHLRRHETAFSASSLFEFGDISVDLANRTVHKKHNGLSEQVHVTATEYRLLTVLIKHAGKIITHQQLLHDVWGPNYSERSHYVRIYMANLRQKLEQDPAQPKHLMTEIGMGYRLVT